MGSWAAARRHAAHQAKCARAQLPFEGPGAAVALAALGHGEAVLLTPYNRFPYFMLRPLPGRGPATQLPSRELQAVLGAHALPAAAAGGAGNALTLGSGDRAGRQPMQAAAGRSSCAGAAAQQARACSAAAGLAAAPSRADDGAALPPAGDGDAATAAAVHPEGAGPSATFASYFRCGLPVLYINIILLHDHFYQKILNIRQNFQLLKGQIITCTV